MVFEENIICFGHMKHMKKKPNSQDECGFGERGGIIVCGLLPPSADSFHRPRTPSTACGRSPSLEEGGLGGSPVKACGLAVDWI